jgi:C4-type Zn-finger protein
VPIEETIIVEECAYKVTKVLVLEYRMPKEFITNRNKLFTLKY